MAKVQILALISCVALVHGKVIGSVEDPLAGTPDSVLKRASQMIHESRKSGSPLRFFMRTSYSTVTQTQTVTSTSTTFNTCYMTESGIIPCNKRRNIEVESKPRVFLQGQEKSWEEIIPTRLSRFEAASDEDSSDTLIELQSNGEPYIQTEKPMAEIATVTLAGREDLDDTTTISELAGREDDSETTTNNLSAMEAKEENVETSTIFTELESKEGASEQEEQSQATTTDGVLESKGVQEVIQSVNKEVASTAIESVPSEEIVEDAETTSQTESPSSVIPADIKDDDQGEIVSNQEIFGVDTVKVIQSDDNSEKVQVVEFGPNEPVTGTPKGDLIIIEAVEAVEATTTINVIDEILEARVDEVELEGSIQNHNWIEREIQGIRGDCFDPSNIALRFLTVIETKVAYKTTTVVEYETGAKIQTVRFAANADACLPTNVFQLFSTKCA